MSVLRFQLKIIISITTRLEAGDYRREITGYRWGDVLVEQPEDLLGASCVVLDTTWPCPDQLKITPASRNLLLDIQMKASVEVVCASLSPIMTQQILPRPIEQL